MRGTAPWWYALQEGAVGEGFGLHGVLDDRHPAGSLVRAARPEGAVLAVEVTGGVTPSGRVPERVRLLGPGLSPGTAQAPPLALGVVLEQGPLRAVTLLGFVVDDPAADGTVLGPGLDPASLPGGAQAVALRWFLDDGVVHQLYVRPGWRRRRLASRLLVLADVLCVAAGWPALQDAGERTDDGERLAQAVPDVWADRVVPRRRALPGMDPAA